MALDKVLGVGVGVPALTDLDGRLVFGPNLRWRDVNLRELLANELGVPVYVDNDTKAAALAETLFGSCRGVNDFLFVIAHSGLGGGLYLGGKLHRGWRGFAGELGHTKVVPGGRPCGCGGRGCLEAYASEPNILARLAEAGAACADLEEAASRAAAGDGAVCAVIEETGELLGRVLTDAVNLLNLERIVLGGRIAVLSRALVPTVRRGARARRARGARRRPADRGVAARAGGGRDRGGGAGDGGLPVAPQLAGTGAAARPRRSRRSGADGGLRRPPAGAASPSPPAPAGQPQPPSPSPPAPARHRPSPPGPARQAQPAGPRRAVPPDNGRRAGRLG